MNRRTLDVLVPMVYVIAIMITVFAGGGTPLVAVAAIGGVCVGAYYAALRQNLRS